MMSMFASVPQHSADLLGHESLLNPGILHRDIPIGNIMLTENEDDRFLIDFDLSIKTSDDRASGAPSKTGTKGFIPIGGLLGEPPFSRDLIFLLVNCRVFAFCAPE